MIRWAQKALTAMRHVGRLPFVLGLLKRTRFDYAREVGSGIDASVVMAPIQWVQRAFPEMRLRVRTGRGDNVREVDEHPLVALVKKPNSFYGDEPLWMGTLFSWYTAGTAYWLKIRNGNGKVVELWYVPHWMMEPKWPDDGSEFISHYLYHLGGGRDPIRVEVQDVVVFRCGIDPRNPRLGLSPLHSALREIFSDLEASNFVASLLKNMGVPGVVISPDGSVQASPDDAEAVKKWFQEAFTGDRRGEPLVLGAPTKVQEYGFTPQQMDLSSVRDVSEERVCALIGVPAAVVGFGAGLQTAKVGATMGELATLAWTNGVLPVGRSFAGDLQRGCAELLRPGEEIDFDSSEVLALAEYRLNQSTAWNTRVQGGWAEVAEARGAAGLDVDNSHRIFLRSFNIVEVPAGQPPRLPAPPAEDPPQEDPDDDPEDPDAGKALDLRRLLKAAKATPPAQLRRYVDALQRQQGPLSELFEGHLKRFFDGIGKEAAAAARPILERDWVVTPAEGQAAAAGGETKSDEILIGQILEQLELPLHQTTFKQLYEAQYLEVGKEAAKAGELVGIATDLPDPVARSIVAAGGRRSGMVDLSKQSRQALFNSLAEGRAAGEGVDQLVARISDQVGGGPWQSAETRARTIARTETKYAQNVSTMARAAHEGVQRFMVFDGRLGPDRSDPEHIARDGSIVTADEAEAMAAAEHPNGTLSLAPYFEEDPS